MLALLGSTALLTAFIGSLLLVWRGIQVARKGPGPDLAGPTKLMLSGAAVAMVAMELALLTDDFSLAYLAEHHAIATRFPFDVATAWAALEGSILLWGLVLAGFTWFTLRGYRRNPDPLNAGALAFMGGIAIFFFGIMLTVTNPFEVCTQAVANGCAASSPWPFAAVQAPLDGPGPNPLLQNNVLMAVHPPMLYLGYVGLSVPFAYALSALALKIPGPEWLRRSHQATIVAWSFLTLGILFGGWWAYTVLSWGGYWVWDPVENASFMPWLVATAFLHSAMVQRRRGMLQAWNFVLVISAFALTILGTFLTRSGTINSVHSFTQSAIGPVLLGFLALVLVGSFTLFSSRAHLVATAPRIESFVSREGTFLVNNLLLSVYAFVVLVGTTYPLFLEAATGTKVGVGEPFFNRIAVPLSFLLLLVMGFGPITPWRGTTPALIWKRTRTPTILALGAGVLTAITVTRIGWVVLAIVLGTFVITSTVGLLVEQADRRAAKLGESRWESAKALVAANQPFWAGQLSHLGVIIVALGIAFAANLGAHAKADMVPGDSIEFAGYTISYESPFQRTYPDRVTKGARMTVTRDGEFVTVMEPAGNFFGADTAGVSRPDIYQRPWGDIYITLIRLEDGVASLTFDTSPLVWLIWLGGLVTTAGGLWVAMARRKDRELRRQQQSVDV
ncbi:MAG: heme lyase CcmF/NrfE family subunit [Acidimicrobiia bacterium]